LTPLTRGFAASEAREKAPAPFVGMKKSKKPRGARYDPKELKSYKDQVHLLRSEWKKEFEARKTDDEAQRRLERERIKKEKAERLVLRQRRAVESLEDQEKLRVDAAELYQSQLRVVLGQQADRRDLRKLVQGRMVDDLTQESEVWIRDVADLDARLTESFFDEPGTTGLMTMHTHSLMRYVADASHDGTNEKSPGLDVLDLNPEAQERMRVATVTESLIRTQTNTLKEYYENLQDAAEIADAVKDMEHTVQKPGASNYAGSSRRNV